LPDRGDGGYTDSTTIDKLISLTSKNLSSDFRKTQFPCVIVFIGWVLISGFINKDVGVEIQLGGKLEAMLLPYGYGNWPRKKLGLPINAPG
jgi:hypothetical protein